MHDCPECGKSMATAGGLEIHVEMFHPPAPAAPEPEAELLEVIPDERTPVAAAARPPRTARRSAPVLRGYDPTIPLTAVLVLTMLVAAIGAAVHRSANPRHTLFASFAAGTSGSPPSADNTPTTLAPVTHAPATPAPSSGGSPAAIPPAGSQSPTAAQNSQQIAACGQLVDSLSERNSKRTVDVAGLIRANTFPALPLAGFESPQVIDLGHWGTVQEYISTLDPNDPETAQWQQLLIQHGFVGAESVEFLNGTSSYGAIIFQFTTASSARAFNRATLLNSCSSGYLENPRVMPGLTGGLNYLIADGPPFRATFVAGDTVVRLHICHCVQAPDDQALAGQWAQAVASHVGAG